MTSVSDPRQLPHAWRRQYDELARRFKALLPHGADIVVEFGCGRGQLTVPLAHRLPHCRFIGVDTFATPYAHYRARMRSVLRREGLGGRVRVVVADFAEWLSDQPDSVYRVVVSSEFLPELTSPEVRRFFAGCFRVTEAGGVTVHSFLSPVPRNAGQRLAIEANCDPRWATFLPREWFSPPPRLVLAELRKAGFESPRTSVLRTKLIVKADAARAMLKDWNVKDVFWDTHGDRIAARGLEIPDWVVLAAKKPR